MMPFKIPVAEIMVTFTIIGAVVGGGLVGIVLWIF